jgi:uncharacterized protein involved in exopolysaccharide biosynthesis
LPIVLVIIVQILSATQLYDIVSGFRAEVKEEAPGGAAAGKVEQVVAADTPSSLRQQSMAPAHPVKRLRTRIAKLEDELQALRDEIRSLQAEGAQEASGGTSVEMNVTAISVEEAA